MLGNVAARSWSCRETSWHWPEKPDAGRSCPLTGLWTSQALMATAGRWLWLWPLWDPAPSTNYEVDSHFLGRIAGGDRGTRKVTASSGLCGRRPAGRGDSFHPGSHAGPPPLLLWPDAVSLQRALSSVLITSISLKPKPPVSTCMVPAPLPPGGGGRASSAGPWGQCCFQRTAGGRRRHQQMTPVSGCCPCQCAQWGR